MSCWAPPTFVRALMLPSPLMLKNAQLSLKLSVKPTWEKLPPPKFALNSSVRPEP